MICASEEQLAGFLLGSCGPDESRVIREHLALRAACRRWVEEASSEEGLFDDVKRVLVEAKSAPGGRGGPTRSSAPRDWVDVSRPSADPAIEGYSIIRELGRGGMGVVYLATQTSTKRKVALKVLLEGPFASPAARRRFEREVELAALLDHPGIVAVLESGIASARYYFAMRYVEGQRLDEWIAGDGLRKARINDTAWSGPPPLRTRTPPSALNMLLALFAQVCDAVSYAHRRGVIHRDLKPSNIIIDDAGHPHVLDFGLAKPAEDGGSGDEALTKLSITGHVMGTLAYMSPEQSAGAHREVDVRSDVYSLGMIFYQLLTGQFPYPVTGRVGDILQNIAEADPKRPRALVGHVNDEIETIVLKALAKAPDRRYQSADALAADIRRYLAGEPIEAKRDSGWYVAKKLLSRYRGPVTVALAFVALLGVGLYLVLSHQARIERAMVKEVLTAFVDDPNAAVRRSADLSPRVKTQLAATAAGYAASPAYTERVAAARCAPWMNPEAFWQSVDGGPLWEHGEWLEVCEVDWKDRPALIDQLLRRRFSQSIPERYVAFCLLGQFAAFDPVTAPPEPRDPSKAIDTRRATAADTDAGTIAAERWATIRSGRAIPPAQGAYLFMDALSGLTFARLPGAASYQRGSPPEDPDRWDDEDVPSNGVPIAAFCMATTEVTYAAFAPFLEEPGRRAELPEDAQNWFTAVEALPAGERDSVAVGHISLNLARRYCEWLNAESEKRKLKPRYRLPTEEEWEYACGGGGQGRFCYGDDPKYARYFAQCDGRPLRFHQVGLKMPNAFGLHDMHGGLWERTESRYPPELLDEPALADQELWIYKGGAFHSPAVRCRRAQRNLAAANRANDYNGFRIVMEPGP